MPDESVGRVLVASLHQGIADVLPARAEFYEGWLNPTGLRDGRVGLAPLNAVLSFLRLEGEPYQLITARAGEYTAEWTVAGIPPIRRAMLRAMPVWLRRRLVMRLAREIVRNTYGGSRAAVHWRRGRGSFDIRDSIFCGVRDRVEHPLCDFYASVVRRLMHSFNLHVDVRIEHCRATGAERCVLAVLALPAGVAGG